MILSNCLLTPADVPHLTASSSFAARGGLNFSI